MIASEIVHSLLHELLYCLNTPMGACSILQDEGPLAISGQIEAIGKAGRQFRDEVKQLYGHPEKEIDVKSPSTAATQIRRRVSGWREYEAVMSSTAQQIREERATGFRMEPPELDAILTGPLLRGLERLDRFMSYLENIETEDMTHWDNERISRLLGLSNGEVEP